MKASAQHGWDIQLWARMPNIALRSLAEKCKMQYIEENRELAFTICGIRVMECEWLPDDRIMVTKKVPYPPGGIEVIGAIQL